MRIKKKHTKLVRVLIYFPDGDEMIFTEGEDECTQIITPFEKAGLYVQIQLKGGGHHVYAGMPFRLTNLP